VGKYQKWGPTLSGLALVPFLPFILDHPVEQAIHWAKLKWFPGSNSGIHKEHKII